MNKETTTSGHDSHTPRALPTLNEQFASLFAGREDAYGTENGGCRYEHPDYDRHLSGDRPMGVYPVRDDGTVSFAVVDLDYPTAPDQNRILAESIRNGLETLGIPAHIERSRSNGWHVWVFFFEPVPAQRARRMLQCVAERCGAPDAEVFPKQDRVGKVGFYIRLPYPGGAQGHVRDQDRMAVWKGDVPLTLEQFVGEAMERRLNSNDLDDALNAAGLPLDLEPMARSKTTLPVNKDFLPCMRVFLEKGANIGRRDLSLFTAAKHCHQAGKSEEATIKILIPANDLSDLPLSYADICQKVDSAYRGASGEGYTSLGCENPLWTEERCPGKEHRRVHGVSPAIRNYVPRDTTPYDVEYGKIVYCSTKSISGTTETVKAPVCDFHARITEEIISEIGDRIFRIEGETMQGGSFDFDITAEAFADDRQLIQRLIGAIGANAVIYHRMNPHVRPAIQKLSDEISETRRYARTGWAGDRFLIPGREPERVSLRLAGRTSYEIDSAADLSQGLDALDALINSQRPEVATVVLAAIFEAPAALLAGWRDERYAVVVTGRTGSLKTSIVQTMMTIYGPAFQREESFIRWGQGATMNAIMSLAANTWDLPLFLDNYKPTTGNGSRDFVNLMHTMLEGGEKLRLNRNSELKDARAVFAWPVVTGEDVPMDDAASLARILVVPFAWQRGEPNPNLSRAQELAGSLCAVGNAWLTWLESAEGRSSVKRWSRQFSDKRQEWSDRLRNIRQDMPNPLRVASNLASSELTWRMLSDCPALTDVVSPYLEAHKAGLIEVAQGMAGRASESLEGIRFLGAISELLAGGKCFLSNHRDMRSSDSGGVCLGWKDGVNGSYLLPTIAFSEADRLLQSSGGLGKMNPETVYKQLKELGMLASTGKGQTTVGRSAGSAKSTVRFLHLAHHALDAEDSEG